MSFNTPILFIIFNRLETASQVFDEVAKIKPKHLYIAADGPRASKPGEAEKCELVRKAILSKITWDCELKTLFRDSNLGCGLAVSGGISWFFNHEEEGIILEDDCLPDLSFFDFCAKMLERYRDNETVKTVSGNNFQNGIKRGDGSYYFSNFADIWGWACWKRTWLEYDFKLKAWPEFRDKKLNKLLHNDSRQIDFWTNTLNSVHAGKIDTWDYQLLFTVWNHNGIAIHPNVNLISNIGFNSEATHTLNPLDKLNNQPRFSYTKDVIPSKIKVDTKADDYNFYNSHIVKTPFLQQIKYNSKQIIKSFIPPILISTIRKFKKSADQPIHGWFGDYKTWEDAELQCTGYDSNIILQKVKAATLKVKSGEAEYERDSMVFEKFEYSEELLDAFKQTSDGKSLSIIDFGGSLGSQYFQYKRFFDSYDVNWMVVEQSHFVDCGKNEIANNQLHFFYTIEDALNFKRANTIVLSSVLPYIKNPFELIEKIILYQFEYIIIDRNPFLDLDRDLITVQIVPEFVYKASYPAWFFNEAKFLKLFLKKYTIEKEINSPFAAPVMINNHLASWKGFIFKRKHE